MNQSYQELYTVTVKHTGKLKAISHGWLKWVWALITAVAPNRGCEKESDTTTGGIKPVGWLYYKTMS